MTTAAAKSNLLGSRLRQVWQRARRAGWRRRLSRWSHRAVWTAAEWWLGLDTVGSIPARELGHAESHFGYQPVDCQSCLLGLRRAGVGAGDVFVDIGCGKGRALLLAAMFPLARVVGVERSAVLCEIARQNVQRGQSWLRCPRVDVVCQDATQYELPQDASILFLYNPFSSAVVQQVLQRTQESLRSFPRSLRIIYALPKMDRDIMQDTPWLRVEQSLHSASCDWQRLTIYSAVPPDTGADPAAAPHTAADTGDYHDVLVR
jgi:SAM-dependent methyltransferase